MSAERIFFRFSLAATLCLWLVMSLWSMPKLDAAGGGPIFDLRFLGYDRAAAEALLTALGADGRAFYLNVQQWLDTVFPAMLALTLILWFRRTAGQGGAAALLTRALSALAVLGAALDYAENNLVRGMLVTGSADGVDMASRVTQIKSAVGAVVLVAAVLLLLAAALRQFRGRA